MVEGQHFPDSPEDILKPFLKSEDFNLHSREYNSRNHCEDDLTTLKGLNNGPPRIAFFNTCERFSTLLRSLLDV
jgi:hypothetical protein